MTRRQSVVAVVLLVTIAFGSVIACRILFRKPNEQIPFDVAGWNAPMVDSEGHFTGTRLKMVDDLLDRYDFHGWGMREVQSLLGEPDYEQVETEGHVVKYDLRDGLKFLIFEINDHGIVVDYRVYMDD